MVKGYLVGTDEILQALLRLPISTAVALARAAKISNHQASIILHDLKESGMVQCPDYNKYELTWEGMRLCPNKTTKTKRNRKLTKKN